MKDLVNETMVDEEIGDQETTDEFQEKLTTVLEALRGNITMVELHAGYVQELYLALDYITDCKETLKELYDLINDEDKKYGESL